MKKYHTANRIAATFAILAGTHSWAQDDQPEELEAFIAQETAELLEDSMLQTDRTISGLGFGDRSILDIPRAVTPLSPETLDQYQIDDVYDLTRVVPGATVVNFYGVPGIPTTRGLFTSIYFNGMQRVWNRNGYPTSFGSLEALEYVKGPPPPSYSAASPGGFVNFIPKSPYFDEIGGSIELEVGKWDHYNAQLDIGGPILIGKKPAAFRISATYQDADSYYDGIFNDYFSLYGSIKVRLNDRVSIFAGGEYYQHRSKENVGWNRVTQDLIDNGEYIVGNPVTDITVVQPDGSVKVDRSVIESATPFGGTYGSFDDSYLARSGFADSGFRVANFDEDDLAFYRNLGAIDNPGTGITTTQISGSTVLTDPNDFADADTYLAFFDVIFTPSSEFTVTLKSFIDGYEREKYSTYGYAEFGENFTFEEKLVIDQSIDLFGDKPTFLSYGASFRYEDSLALTDFTVEPFSRRDITQATIDPNTILPTGPDLSPGGTTHWDPFGSYESELETLGAFFNFSTEIFEGLSLNAGIRYDEASWETFVPADENLAFNGGNLVSDDTESYSNFSISPSYKVSEDVTLYYTYQEGTAFQGYYVSGSVNAGKDNFQESTLQELGVRASLNDGKVFVGATLFDQELVNFEARGGQAVPQSGSGLELESTWLASDSFIIQANATWQEHEYDADTIPGGFVPLTPEETIDFSGIFPADFGGRLNPGGDRYGIPDFVASILFMYNMDNGFGVSGGPTYTSSIYLNPDQTIMAPDHLVWNANIFYKTDTYEISLGGSNLTSEDVFYASDAFAANSIVTKGAPFSWTLKYKYKF